MGQFGVSVSVCLRAEKYFSFNHLATRWGKKPAAPGAWLSAGRKSRTAVHAGARQPIPVARISRQSPQRRVFVFQVLGILSFKMSPSRVGNRGLEPGAPHRSPACGISQASGRLRRTPGRRRPPRP